MKIVKGKLFSLKLHDYTFLVLTSDRSRAFIFFNIVFPDETFLRDEIVREDTIYSKDTLKETLAYVKEEWRKMGLLQAQPGCIKFNKTALDILLEDNETLLTNT